MVGRLEFWAEYLNHSQNMTNVTLVSVDSQHKETHVLLLASVSEFLGSLLFDSKDTKEKTVILLPDFTMEDVEDCLQFLITGELNNTSLAESLCIPYDSKLKLAFENDINNINCKNEKIEEELKTYFETEKEIDGSGQNENVQICSKDDIEYNATLKSHREIERNIEKRQQRGYSLALKSEEIFQCPHCPHFYSTENALEAHKRNTTKHKNLSYEKEDWYKYVEKSENEYKCNICENFSSNHIILRLRRRKVREHIYLKHEINQELACPKCDKMFHYKWRLNEHLLQHDNLLNPKTMCNQCGTITRKTYLRAHEINVHGTEEDKLELKKFQCSNCDKRFSNKREFKSHEEQRHGDGTIHKCSECDSKFKSNIRLNVHVRVMHIKTKKHKTEEEKEEHRKYAVLFRARQRKQN